GGDRAQHRLSGAASAGYGRTRGVSAGGGTVGRIRCRRNSAPSSGRRAPRADPRRSGICAAAGTPDGPETGGRFGTVAAAAEGTAGRPRRGHRVPRGEDPAGGKR